MALLDRTVATLPASWYHDPAQYARELEAVWYRDWVCVGRSEEIRERGDYVLATVGEESLVLTRDRDGRPRAFHNSCRHRGSRLCTEPRGRFAAGRIVCPYHAWTYGLGGELLATPRMQLPADFRREDYPLHAAHAGEWGGFLFVNLDGRPARPLAEFLGREAENVRRWPLASLVSVNREVTTLGCNWKVFWENYSECYHCPGVHPELCRVVPLYREGLLSYGDSREGPPPGDPDDDRPRVAPGYATWTLDGQSRLPPIEGPSEADRALGVVFASFTASLFVVAHPDYVRSVRIAPRGPESVELTVDWLLPPGVAERHADALGHLYELGRRVVAQDGRVCELNQQGLRSRRFGQGVLMPQEESLQAFHEWLRLRLAEVP
ncbi:MAG TPA: aromatic ring-hydroxylating dioxygenase subunit alpha [Steroidobacteraceae bacterium]|nr:aromatic ring-hydroxylating dioxygenase subunit alpha [Steroidobacteraceae bacterium]